MRHSTIRLEHQRRPGRNVQAFAPGRENLIGEHTDYNYGLCLPFAIEPGITVSADVLNADDRIEAHALDLSEQADFRLGHEGPPSDAPEGWTRFVRGATSELRKAGIELRPCRLEFSGDLPGDKLRGP